MSLASLTVDLTIGLAKFQSDSGKAAQIVTRDSETMARATAKADAALQRYLKGFTQVGVESKAVAFAVAGASDEALKLLAGVGAGGAAFARAGTQGSAAFREIGAAADDATKKVESNAARILLIAEKARQVGPQADALIEKAKAENAAGTLSDDGLKKRIADVRAVQAAELDRILVVARADAEARRAAQAERATSSKGAIGAIDTASTAQAAAQSQVYAAFLIAQAAAAEKAAQAEARLAEVSGQIAAASDRARAAQQAAYETKVAFIGKVNEEAAALFRTKDAQRQLDAERAGVSPQQAAQLAKFAGDREFLSTIREQIAAEQKKADQFEKTATQILQQEAALRGLTNTAAGAISRFDALAVANQKAVAASAQAKSNDAYIASIERQVAVSGKARSEIVAMELAERGLAERGAPLVARLKEIDAATGQLGKGAFATRNQLLTLKYTVSDIISSAGSGISPLTILLQQGPQLAQIEGGLTGIFKTIVSLATPARLVLTGVASAVGVLAYAYYEGSKASKAFVDSQVLTGGFAGQTEGQFNSLAKTIAATSNISRGAARDFAQALVSTGEIGPKAFALSAEAAARYGEATGKAAKDVAAEFATLNRDVYAGASKLNQSLNFLSAAQLQQIQRLQDQGRATEAYALTVGLLNDRLKGLETNFGSLERATVSVGKFFKDMWDRVLDVGRTETIEAKIQQARARLAQAQLQADDKPSIGVYGGQRPSGASVRDVSAEELRLLNRSRNAQEDAAADKAATAELDKKATAASDYYRAAEKGAKAAAGMVRELAEEQRQYDALVKRKATDPSVELPAATTRTAIQKRIRESYTDKPAVSEANSERKSQLAKDLQVFTEQLAQESDALRFHQSELQAIYAAGNVSLAQFYDDKEKTAAAGAQAELAALTKAQDRLRAELAAGKFKAPNERTDTEKALNESLAKSANVLRDAEHQAALAVYERAAAVKALGKEVENFNVNLLQARGDDFGAAQLRNAQALRDALEFARKATPLQSTGDVAREERRQEAGTSLKQKAEEQGRLNDAAVQFIEIQRRVGVATADAARAEELFLLRSTQGGASLIQQEQGVYTIRATALVQLGEQRDKAIALAAAFDAAASAQGLMADPKYAAAAKDLALAYAKAADAVDPALTRLRGLGDEVGTSLIGIFDGAINKATSFKDVIKSIGNTLKTTFIKGFITQPLEKDLQGVIRKFIDGGSPLAGIFRDGAGVSKPDQSTNLFAADAQKYLASQTSAVVTSTDAFTALTTAVNGTATVLGGKPAAGGPAQIEVPGLFAKYAGASSDPTAANYVSELDKQESAKSSTAALSEVNSVAAALGNTASVLSVFKNGTFDASAALYRMPQIISLISSAATAFGSSSGSGSWIGTIAKLFGGSSSTGAGMGNDVALAYESHTGGIVGISGTPRAANAAMFAGAARYHSGGMAGGGRVAGLKTHEVPAVLMGGPKGVREEVLHASDPRHSDNLAPALLKLIMGSKGSAAPDAARVVGGQGSFDKVKRYHEGGIVSEWAGQSVYSGVAPIRVQQQSQPAAARGGNIYVTNNSPAEVKDAKRDDNGDWHLLVEMAADRAHSRVAADIGSGSGRVSASMKSRGVNLSGNLPKRG